MPKEERNLNQLADFLPPNTFELVAPYFQEYPIHLSLTHERKSVLGDYRAPWGDKKHHTITVNGTLNTYSFLITLLHELAHMLTFIAHKHSVQPHGKEWKEYFRKTLLPFINKQLLPQDIEQALVRYINNPAASTCTDKNLYKTLARYDKHPPGWKFVDELENGSVFALNDGLLYKKLEQRRSRSRCVQLKTGKEYLVPGIMLVNTNVPQH